MNPAPPLFASAALIGACLTVPLPSTAARSAPPRQEEHWTQAELERVALEIQGDIEQIRGEKFLRPVAVKLASREDLIAYVKARVAKTETPEKLRADEQIAKLLGVVPPEMDVMAVTLKMLEGQVAGFYDPDSDSFSLMDTTPRGLAKVTMAHELGHALDDQLYGIDVKLAECGLDTDAQLAFQSVVEGSGTAVMNLWTLSHMDQLDVSALSALQSEQAGSMKDAPAWLWKPMIAVYMQGAAFLQDNENWVAAQTGKVEPASIRQAFEQRPRSTEQVLHPHSYWNAERRDEPRALKYAVGKLPEGWSVRREDTLGEFMSSLVAGAAGERATLDLSNPLAVMGLKFGNPYAAGWGGDRLVLLGKDDALVLRWTTVWDSERDAGEFFAALSLRSGELESAAKALGKRESAVEIGYGEARDEVVLSVRAGAKKRELKDVLAALAVAR